MTLTPSALDVLPAEPLLPEPPAAPSVWAELREKHPEIPVQRLRKATLLALSWAIEDEFAARSAKPLLFGCFQEDRFYRAAEERWVNLAHIAEATLAFARFDETVEHHPEASDVVHQVHLDPAQPMQREWTVVCDSTEFPALLVAWEIPGQDEVPERDRLYESMWTVERHAVRDAARVCAQVALQNGVEAARPVLFRLADEPADTVLSPAAASALFGRVVAYVDRFGQSRG